MVNFFLQIGQKPVSFLFLEFTSSILHCESETSWDKDISWDFLYKKREHMEIIASCATCEAKPMSSIDIHLPAPPPHWGDHIIINWLPSPVIRLIYASLVTMSLYMLEICTTTQNEKLNFYHEYILSCYAEICTRTKNEKLNFYNEYILHSYDTIKGKNEYWYLVLVSAMTVHELLSATGGPQCCFTHKSIFENKTKLPLLGGGAKRVQAWTLLSYKSFSICFLLEASNNRNIPYSCKM